MRRFCLMFAVLAVFACGTNDGVGPVLNVPFSMTDLVIGSGPAASNGQELQVAFTGWLYNETAAENKGAQFDAATASNPFVFVLGAGRVIAGWDQGVVGMQVGGQRRLVIPSSLGFGAAGAAPAIPGNATLIFDIELLDIN